MKITRILAYRVELLLHETTYKWSGGKSVTVFDSTIVRVETDAGIVGHGEVCPLDRSICRLTRRACARDYASWDRTCSVKIRASLRSSITAWTARSRDIRM